MSTIAHPVVSRYRRLALTAPAAALAVTILAGCGGGSEDNATGALTAATGQTAPDSAAPDSAAQPSSAPNGTQGNGANRTFPGASGQIAEITGKTMQVQSTSSQTAVTYNDSTKITNTVTATRADLSVGDCVSVRDTSMDAVTNAGGGTDVPSGQPTPSAIVDPNAAVEASTVTISDAVDGVCSGGFGGLGGSLPQGFPPGGQAPNGGQMPNGGQIPQGGQFPQGGANGTRPDGARGFGGGANGKVTKIDGDTITVEMTRPAAPSSDGSTTGQATTTARTVNLSSATTYTKTVSATASALKIGSCVVAFGTANDTGSLTASSIAISPAVNNSCATTGFGRFDGGNRANGTSNG